MPDPLGTLGEGLNGMQSNSHAHGSGSIDDRHKISAYSYYYEDGVIPVQYGMELEPVVNEENQIALPGIWIDEVANRTFSTTTFGMGKGYYAEHPIFFQSLLKDRIWIKNLDSGSSMNNEIEYAQSLKKDLKTSADYIDVENTTMNMDESIIQGRAHIGALQLPEIPNIAEIEDEEGEASEFAFIVVNKAKPIIEIDEDYMGTFHLSKNMTLVQESDTSENYENLYEDNWLPCCFSGYLTMPTYYQWGPSGFGSEVKGVFDCTCYKTHLSAQWPRVYQFV